MNIWRKFSNWAVYKYYSWKGELIVYNFPTGIFETGDWLKSSSSPKKKAKIIWVDKNKYYVKAPKKKEY